MYLKEVILNGFKSFAVRTRLALKPGVTTIVGPNGCGKSNIVDAIRWVLGEQSAKALRGGKMHDVIFEGTDKRAQLNMCEVTLVFTDCEAQLGTAFNEVEITRRVTRDGGSDYFLNGKKSRLKDIQNLFMDTGIGRVSYSFMMQGQIDQILSSNPMERRGIFEEAAGITRYKAQRKETMNKLALVDQNLSRAIDVMEEVCRQKASVQRQARKALRYQHIKHRLSHLELASQSYQFYERKNLLAELEHKAQAMHLEVESVHTSLADEEAELEVLKATRSSLYEALQQTQQAVFDHRSEADQAQNQIELTTIRREDITERIEAMRHEISELNEKEEGLAAKIEGDAQYQEEQASIVGSSEGIFKRRNEELAFAENALRDAESELTKLKATATQEEALVETSRVKSTELEVEVRSHEVKRMGFEEKLLSAREEQTYLEAQLENILLEKANAQEGVYQAKAAIEASQAVLSENKHAFKEQQRFIQDQDRLVSGLNAQANALKALQEKFEGFGEGTKAILKGELADLFPPSEVALLMQSIEVEKGYASSVELLLGSASDALLLENRDAIEALFEALKERSLGRVCVVHPSAKKHGLSRLIRMPEGIIPMTDLVKAKDLSLSGALETLFQGCYWVQDLKTWLHYCEANPDFSYLFAITQAGELVDCRGLVFGGGVESQALENSFLQRAAEITRLEVQIQLESQKLQTFTKKAEAIQNALDTAEATLEKEREALQQFEGTLSEWSAEEKSIRNRIEASAATVVRTQEELEAHEEAFHCIQGQLDEALEVLAQSRATWVEAKALIEQKEADIVHLREDRERKQHVLSEVRVEFAQKKQRLELLSQTLEQLKGDYQSTIQRRMHLGQEIDALEAQFVKLAEDAQNLTARLDQLRRYLEEKTQILEEKRQELIGVEDKIKVLDETLSVKRSLQHDHEKALNKVEVRLAEQKSQVSFLIEKARTEYEVDLQEVDWKDHLWKADEPFETKVSLDELMESDEELELQPKGSRGEPSLEDLQAMEDTDWDSINTEAKTLRQKLASLGAVNLVAIEEYGELKDRFDFLKTQTDDLIHSKEELIRAIEEINETSQLLFQETFEKVKENFKYTFESLFGGGIADLELQDHDNILDSGIDIIARPPGTKLRSLTLLSGGQKTMTAVALLFAIYMVKPSPFCVLDELDAPLDDANIGRFTNILKQFTQYSQFLVISHNKRTISASDIIYGVTMQERGVTSLISMKFDHKTGRTEHLKEAGQAVHIKRMDVVEKEVAQVSAKF